MKISYWILPDTHFGHHKIKDYCQRPEGFENRLLDNIKKYIQPNDILIHLGDFCIYKDEEWTEMFMSSCLAKKWLVLGNHDKKSMSWYLSHGWDCVAETIMLDIFGKKILLSHKPIMDGVFDINIHGHFHNTHHHPECIANERNKLVFIEHEYMPLNLKTIIEKKR